MTARDRISKVLGAIAAEPPRIDVNRYARLGPEAQALVDDHDVIDLAEMLVTARAELAATRTGRPLPPATLQPTITDTHTWDGTHTLPDWLHWDGDRLALPGRDDNTRPQPGWMLVRWSDGHITVASPQVAARVYGPDGMRGRLERAEAELADRDAAESADAAAGSYAGRAEGVEARLTAIADLIADHEGDEWAAHPATTTLRGILDGAEPTAGDGTPPVHAGGNAEDCPVCRPEIDKTVLYPWVCTEPTAAADGDGDLTGAWPPDPPIGCLNLDQPKEQRP